MRERDNIYRSQVNDASQRVGSDTAILHRCTYMRLLLAELQLQVHHRVRKDIAASQSCKARCDKLVLVQVNYLVAEIKNLRRGMHDKLWKFGQQATVKVVHALNNVYLKKFSRPPIGPVGQYLNLTEHRQDIPGSLTFHGCTLAVAPHHLVVAHGVILLVTACQRDQL